MNELKQQPQQQEQQQKATRYYFRDNKDTDWNHRCRFLRLRQRRFFWVLFCLVVVAGCCCCGSSSPSLSVNCCSAITTSCPTVGPQRRTAPPRKEQETNLLPYSNINKVGSLFATLHNSRWWRRRRRRTGGSAFFLSNHNTTTITRLLTVSKQKFRSLRLFPWDDEKVPTYFTPHRLVVARFMTFYHHHNNNNNYHHRHLFRIRGGGHDSGDNDNNTETKLTTMSSPSTTSTTNLPSSSTTDTAVAAENNDNNDNMDPWSKVGGGAINEKPRTTPTTTTTTDMTDTTKNNTTSSGRSSSGFDPSRYPAHLYHALEGLHRYPNYLSRWQESDMDSFEQALEEKLQQVQEQRHKIQQERQSLQQHIVSRCLSMNHDDNDDDNDNGNDIGVLSFSELHAGPTDWEWIRTKMLHPQFAKAILVSPTTTTLSSSSSSSRKRRVVLLPNKNRNSPLPMDQVLSGSTLVELDMGKLLVHNNNNDDDNDDDDTHEVVENVYAFPVLRPEFCAALRNYVTTILFTQYEEGQQPQEGQSSSQSSPPPPKQFGLRPLDLDTIGLRWVNDVLFHLVLRPLARALYQPPDTTTTTTNAELDWRQGYIAAYAAQPTTQKPRRHLVTHTDDSEVTLNIGLSVDAELHGGAIEFRGLRGSGNQKNTKHTKQQEGQLIGTVQPKEGVALIHEGRQFHNVQPVQQGDRYALILWARSWSGVRHQTCPCCWLNRRRGTDCICGARWN